MMKYIYIAALLYIVGINNIYAQNISQEEFAKLKEQVNSQKPGSGKFLLSGSANMETIIDAEVFDNATFGAGWLPIFLWKPTDKLLFEGHLHIEIEAESGFEESGGGGGHQHGGGGGEEGEEAAGGPMVMLGYANLNYILNKNMTITGGYFLSPLNAFSERFHPAWVNKFPDVPLGLGHHNSVGPPTEVGVQIRGGIPFGKLKMNYALYVSNGPALKTSEMEAGMLSYGNYKDNNKNKAIGGRLGLLPFSNSSLEVGVFGQTARVGSENSDYQNINATLYGGDISYIKGLSFLKGDINIKGQWNFVEVGKANFPMDSTMMAEMTEGMDSMMIANMGTTYTFENKSDAFYIQLSYRSSKSSKKFIKNLEFAVRYDALNLPEGSMWEDNDSRITFGLDYWLQARSVFKLAYQVGANQNLMMAQWVIGF